MPTAEEWRAAESIAHDSFAKRCSGLFGEKWEDSRLLVSLCPTSPRIASPCLLFSSLTALRSRVLGGLARGRRQKGLARVLGQQA